MNFANRRNHIAFDMLFDRANHSLNDSVTQHVNDMLNQCWALNVYRTVNQHLILILARRLFVVLFLR
jgi:hypothetical protein